MRPSKQSQTLFNNMNELSVHPRHRTRGTQHSAIPLIATGGVPFTHRSKNLAHQKAIDHHAFNELRPKIRKGSDCIAAHTTSLAWPHGHGPGFRVCLSVSLWMCSGYAPAPTTGSSFHRTGSFLRRDGSEEAARHAFLQRQLNDRSVFCFGMLRGEAIGWKEERKLYA